MALPEDLITGLQFTQEEVESFAGAKKVQGNIQKIRSVHHRLAQMKAQGLKDVEISAITGWSQSRLCILGSDPTFAGLVQFYINKGVEAFVDVQTKFLSLGLDAMEELHERIVEDPESVSDKQLLEVAAFAMDRAGFAPVQKSVSASYSGQLNPDEVRRVKEELKQGSRAYVTTKNHIRSGGGEPLPQASHNPPGPSQGERGAREDVREESGEASDEMGEKRGDRGGVIPWPVDKV